MINSIYVILLLAIFSILLLVYYLVKKSSIKNYFFESDEHAIKKLKSDLKEKGCTDDVIDDWVIKEFNQRAKDRKQMEEKNMQQDTLFFILWVTCFAVIILITGQLFG